jgi:HK97 family phage major capsid protein
VNRFKQLISEGKGIIGKAEAEGRDLTDAEANRVEALIKRAQGVQRDDALTKQLGDLVGAGSGSRPTKKLSELVSESLRRMGAKDLSTTPSAIVSVDFIGTPGTVEGVIGSRIFSVFPQRTVSGGNVRFLRQTQTVAKVPAAVVAPGAAKPVATWDLVNIDAAIPTIALLSPDIANNVLRDGGPDLERFLDTVLAADVYRTLDAVAYDALAAAAAAAGNTQTYASSPSVTIRKSVTQLEVDGFEATHVFVHPTEHEALALATDAEGRYFFGGPEEASVARAWSMKLVSSPAVDAGTAVVVAAPIAALGVLREDVELAVDSITGFNVNESRIRAEMRAMLAVTAPNAIVSADLTP